MMDIGSTSESITSTCDWMYTACAAMEESDGTEVLCGLSAGGTDHQMGNRVFSIRMLLRKCEGHDDVFGKLSDEHNKHFIPPDPTLDLAALIGNSLVVVMNIVLWPRKVVFMLFLLSDQLKLADELLNSDTD